MADARWSTARNNTLPPAAKRGSKNNAGELSLPHLHAGTRRPQRQGRRGINDYFFSGSAGGTTTTVVLSPALPGSPLGPSAPGAPAGPGTGTGTTAGGGEGAGRSDRRPHRAASAERLSEHPPWRGEHDGTWIRIVRRDIGRKHSSLGAGGRAARVQLLLGQSSGLDGRTGCPRPRCGRDEAHRARYRRDPAAHARTREHRPGRAGDQAAARSPAPGRG